MKTISHIKNYCVLLLSLAVFLFLVSCQDDADDTKPAVVTEIRNYAASPNDTAIQTLQTGQWVVLMGKNLSDVSEVFFGGVQATMNRTLLTDQSIIVQVPSIPFQSVPAIKVNEVTLRTKHGLSVFTINIIGAPLISRIRNHADNKIVTNIAPGQQINIIGYNLKNAKSISFQGVDADLSNVIYTDTSAIVHVPGLAGSDDALVDVITYTNSAGAGTFKVKMLGPPIITSVSYENPNEGDVVYLYGKNFLLVESVTFAGETVSSYEVASDSSWVKFTSPTLTQAGPVVITTAAGTFTTLYNVNDVTSGVLANFDAISPVGWGGYGATVSDDATKFPGNKGKYAILKNDPLTPWDWNAWAGGRIMILDAVTWLPSSNLSDPLSNWAVKFEINVPDDWNGTTLFISSEHGDFRAYYEPWKNVNGDVFPYRTTGWQTVTFPLSTFVKDWASTKATTSIKELIGDTGVNPIAIQTMNISDKTTPTGLNAAVDNIRVIKIK